MRVLKFGGSSMASAASRERVIQKIREQRELSEELVIVVSAMGRQGDPYATDTLLDLVHPDSLSPRERDLLMMCGEVLSAVVLSSELNRLGIEAQALTGAEAGIITNGDHGDAEILEIHPDRIIRLCREGVIPVVAGFQGRNRTFDITTLGRGGSDTSAVALAAALNCPVDIYTDVPGVYTADPRLVPTAKVLREMAYEELLEMALAGSKVVHPRAVAAAFRHQVPIRVLSTFDSRQGTAVSHHSVSPTKALHSVTGIAHQDGLVGLEVHATSAEHLHGLLQEISDQGINIDMINLFARDFYCVVEEKNRERIQEILSQTEIRAYHVRFPVTKLTVVGASISDWPGIMARIYEALSLQGISIWQTSDSQSTISILVSHEDSSRAMNILHELFLLSQDSVKPT